MLTVNFDDNNEILIIYFERNFHFQIPTDKILKSVRMRLIA